MEGEEMFHVNNFMSSQIKSRRKRNAPSGENSESGAAGQGANEGWAWYHCKYCNEDITRKIHIKCAVCPDYDLCIECYSVESEVTPHINSHPYRVKEPRGAGCCISAEADIYLPNKRRKETEEGVSRPNNHRVPNALMSPNSAGARPAGPANSISFDELAVAGYYGVDLLSEPEIRLCAMLRMSPAVYLKMQMQLSTKMIAGTVTSKFDAHQLFRMDTVKIDRVYDMLMKKGCVVLKIRKQITTVDNSPALC